MLHEQLVSIINYTRAQEVAKTPKPLHLQLVFCNWGRWEVPLAQLVPLFPTGPSWKAPQAAPSHSETLGNKEERTGPWATPLCRRRRRRRMVKGDVQIVLWHRQSGNPYLNFHLLQMIRATPCLLWMTLDKNTHLHTEVWSIHPPAAQKWSSLWGRGVLVGSRPCPWKGEGRLPNVPGQDFRRSAAPVGMFRRSLFDCFSSAHNNRSLLDIILTEC